MTEFQENLLLRINTFIAECDRKSISEFEKRWNDLPEVQHEAIRVAVIRDSQVNPLVAVPA